MVIHIKEIIGFLGGILTLAGFATYIFSVIRTGTKPKRSTWWIWSINSMMLLSSYFAEGAKETIWLAVGYAIGCVVIAFFSIRYGTGGSSKLDQICFLFTAVAIIFWFIIGPLVTLIITLLIDLLGVLPTILNSKNHPEEENKTSWILWFFGGMFSILAIENIFIVHKWTFAMVPILAYPAQITITAGIIVWLILKSQKPIK